jgi:hypothetical protein
MTKNAETFSVNDRIVHSVYGPGTISRVDARHTTIVFDEAGTKKFVTSMVQLEQTTTPAPAKTPRSKKAKATAKK